MVSMVTARSQGLSCTLPLAVQDFLGATMRGPGKCYRAEAEMFKDDIGLSKHPPSRHAVSRFAPRVLIYRRRRCIDPSNQIQTFM